MTITELLKAAQFVVDGAGKQSAVQLPLPVWEELISLLEDLEDIEELAQFVESDEEILDWEQAKEDLRAEGLDV